MEELRYLLEHLDEESSAYLRAAAAEEAAEDGEGAFGVPHPPAERAAVTIRAARIMDFIETPLFIMKMEMKPV